MSDSTPPVAQSAAEIDRSPSLPPLEPAEDGDLGRVGVELEPICLSVEQAAAGRRRR